MLAVRITLFDVYDYQASSSSFFRVYSYSSFSPVEVCEGSSALHIHVQLLFQVLLEVDETDKGAHQA